MLLWGKAPVSVQNQVALPAVLTWESVNIRLGLTAIPGVLLGSFGAESIYTL